jgi:hypothetical protein
MTEGRGKTDLFGLFGRIGSSRSGGRRGGSPGCAQGGFVETNVAKEALVGITALLGWITGAILVTTTGARGVCGYVIGAPAVLILEHGEGVAATSVVACAIGLVNVMDCFGYVSAIGEAPMV